MQPELATTIPESQLTLSTSIVIPLASHLSNLEATISTLLTQDDSTEVILVFPTEDGFTDRLSQMDSQRIRLVNEPQADLAHQLNAGTRAAKGTYVTWIVSDSEDNANRISELRKALSLSQASLAFLRQDTSELDLALLFQQNPQQGLMMVRRECLEQVGAIASNLEGGELWDYALRIAEQFEIVSVKGEQPFRKETAEAIALRKQEINRMQMLRNALNRLSAPQHPRREMLTQICQGLLTQIEEREQALWEAKTAYSLLESVLANESNALWAEKEEHARDREDLFSAEHRLSDAEQARWAREATIEQERAEQAAVIERKIAELNDLSTHAANLHAELTSIYSSKAWKLITLLRLFKKGLKYVIRLGRK